MYPILYPSTETAFVSNGRGILSDAVSCKVVEERNGVFELEMQYPAAGIHYADIAQRAIILAKPNRTGEAQPFRIYQISRPMGGVVTVNAQHISYDLSGVPVAPFSAANISAALNGLKTNAAAPCPFTFWTDKGTVGTFKVDVPVSIRSRLGGVEGSILDVYGGGDYEFDGFTVRLHASRGQDRGVTIRYGKNLTDLVQEENCASVYTGVYPYWQSTEGQLVQLPEKTVPAPGTFDFVRILPLDLSGEWQEAPEEDALRARAQKYIRDNSISVPKVSLEVKFAQLEQTEEYKGMALLEGVHLCDTVRVEFAALGVSAQAKCIKTVYDVLLDRFDSVELGDARATIADTIAENTQAIKNMREEISSDVQNAVGDAVGDAVKNATALITGNKGGYVVLHSSTGSEEPDEILIMDKPKITEATQVWRWNKSGLGYSGNGYEGPYGTAITIDGKILADFITTGVVQSLSGATRYDLDGGTIRMGQSADTRVEISAGKINWFYQNFLTGVLHSQYGKSYIGSNSEWTFLGWFSNGAPDFTSDSGGANSNFAGIAITNTDGGKIHCNVSKLEIPGRIECTSLYVNGRQIT